MTLAEVKENLAGLVDEPRWGSFWAAARKHPQLVSSGTGKSAMVSWSSSAGEAEASVHRSFEEAPPLQKIEIARKSARRSKELARFFGETLAAEARKAAAEERPALAWELSQAAARLLPGQPEAFPAAQLLAVRRPAFGHRPNPRSRGPREGARVGARGPRRLGRSLRRSPLQGRRRAGPDGALRRARGVPRAVRGALAPHPAFSAAGAPRLPLALRAAARGGQARARGVRGTARSPANSYPTFSESALLLDARRAAPGGVLQLPRALEGAVRPREPRGLDRPVFRLGGGGPRLSRGAGEGGRPGGAPAGPRQGGPPDEVPGPARSRARVSLLDGRGDRGAPAGAGAPEAGGAARQRRGDAGGERPWRPDGEFRVPRGQAETRVPVGAHRGAVRRAVALAGARALPHRDLGSAGRDPGDAARAGDGSRASGDDPGPLGLATRRRRSTPTSRSSRNRSWENNSATGSRSANPRWRSSRSSPGADETSGLRRGSPPRRRRCGGGGSAAPSDRGSGAQGPRRPRWSWTGSRRRPAGLS